MVEYSPKYNNRNFMNIKPTTLFIFLTLTTSAVFGQTYEPMELAKKIFGKDSLTNIQNYIVGEYEGRPNGQDLQKGSITRFTLLGQTEEKSVVAMNILDSTGIGFDTYLHFEKHTTWKMSALRALAMTGMIEQVKAQLEKMTPQQVDSIVIKNKTKDESGNSQFESREDYNFLLGNTKLTLESDENIIKHFLVNKIAFERIKNLVLKQLKNEKMNTNQGVKLIENLKTDYQKLFISSISARDYELGNCINFLIGGILDNSVGYIYVKDKKDLPEMTSNKVIMIREIGKGWYIYKTT
jgi:hypothetical protein